MSNCFNFSEICFRLTSDTGNLKGAEVQNEQQKGKSSLKAASFYP